MYKHNHNHVQSERGPARFEPALIPITPKDHVVEVLYQVPISAIGEIITVIVDTPYNVIDVRNSCFYHVYSIIEGN